MKSGGGKSQRREEKRREGKGREGKSKSKKLRQSHPETTQRKRDEHIA
jgi:hypothetical protein